MKSLRLFSVFLLCMVFAVCLAGCGGGGGGGGTGVSSNPQPPSAPTGLAANPGNNQVSLSWTASSGAATYNVYRGTASGALSTKTEITTGVTGTSCTDTTAANGTAYYYQVTAVDSAGESAGSNEANATPVNSTQITLTPAPSGIAIVPATNQATWTSVLQVVTLFDSNGNPLATPAVSSSAMNGNDYDGAALSPNGEIGIIADGWGALHLFASTPAGIVHDGYYMNNFPDLDSVAFIDNDEAVISVGSADHISLYSGFSSGNANAPGNASNVQWVKAIPTSNGDGGVLVSADGKVLLSRGPNGLAVFSVSGTAPYSFTPTAPNLPLGDSAGREMAGVGGGHDGMAFSPTDSDRAVIITNGTSSTVSLLTGLNTAPVIASTVTLSGSAFSVAIVPGSPSDLAIVGMDSGLVMFSGVSTGNLTQVGQLFSNNGTLGRISSVGITSDGKYAVVCDYSNNRLLIIPVSASGFGNPVGMTAAGTFLAPSDDEMMVH